MRHARVDLLAAAVLCALVPAAVPAARAPVPRSAAPARPPSFQAAGTVAPQDEEAIRTLVEGYLAAQAAKDEQAYVAAWHSASPDLRVRQAMAATLFRYQDFAFSNLRVSRFAVDADGASARVTVDARITDTRRKQVDDRTWVRAYTFRQANGAWRFWHESFPVNDLAAALAALPTEPEQLALLDQDPDLLVDDLRVALAREANTALGKRETARAIGLMKLAVVAAERTKDPASVAAAWIDLALQYQTMGDFPSALEGFEQALASLGEANDPARVAATEMNTAAVYYRLHKYPEAAAHYQRALEGYEAIGEYGWSASILHSLGNTAYLLGEWDRALDFYRRTLALQEKTAAESGGATSPMLQARGMAAAWQAIGLVLKEQADYPSAIEAFEQSRARYASYDDTSGIVNVEQSMGEVFRLQGSFAPAIRHFLDALDAAGRMRADVRDQVNEARLLAEIGEVYGLEQRYGAALDSFQKSLALMEATKNREGTAGVLGAIGGVQFLRGAFEPALDHLQKALAIRDELQDARAAAFLHAQIGLVHAAEDKDEEALVSYGQALQKAEIAGDRTAVGIAHVLMASAHLALGRPDEAVESAGKGAGFGNDAGNLDVVAHAHLVTGRAQLARGETDAAMESVRQAMSVVERLRAAGVRADERFFNDTISPYMDMVHLLILGDRRQDAFAMLERARQVRMQMLLGNGAVIVKGLGDEEQTRERQLRRRVASLGAQVRKANDQAQPDLEKLGALSRELASATETSRAFEEQLYAAHPALKILRAKMEPEGPPAAADVVDARTALLEFAVSEQGVHLFVVFRPPAAAPAAPAGRTAETAPPPAPPALVTEVYSLEIRAADLGKRVAEFRERIAAKAPEADDTARELYDLLLKPAEGRLAGARRLVIVPDGVLWALPFQALLSPAGRYVIQDRAVAYGTSLTTLVAQARHEAGVPPAPAGKTLRVVAAGLVDPGAAAVAQMSLVRPDLKFEPMPQAEREARGVGALFAPAAARVRAGREAQADSVREAARTAAVLHLAVPGLLVDASPLGTLLVFAPPDAPPDADGAIEAGDVMAWDVAARTVVLSRLQGDPAQQAAGAAARALAWAWFVAGAPTTVMTEWVVDAASTRTLMLAFERRLQPAAGRAPRASEALRLATLPLLTGPTRHPYYWAAFRVMGGD